MSSHPTPDLATDRLLLVCVFLANVLDDAAHAAAADSPEGPRLARVARELRAETLSPGFGVAEPCVTPPGPPIADGAAPDLGDSITVLHAHDDKRLAKTFALATNGQVRRIDYDPGATCSEAGRVRGVLLARLEALVESLLGAPSIRKLRTWRWGGRGSGPFQLIQHARSCSMADAIRCGRARAGGETIHAERPRAPAKDDAADIADRARRIWVVMRNDTRQRVRSRTFPRAKLWCELCGLHGIARGTELMTGHRTLRGGRA